MLLLIWSTPRFSTDQLLFNVLWTAWIIVGTRLEERDLLANFGQTYRSYQASVPMLIPSPRAVLRQWQSRSAAEPGAPPNGAPATPSGKSEATEGPPSVSRA
jgi:hypothetical protein